MQRGEGCCDRPKWMLSESLLALCKIKIGTVTCKLARDCQLESGNLQVKNNT
jgi:hypothetical protein